MQVTATEAKTEPVFVEKDGRIDSVILSVQQFEADPNPGPRMRDGNPFVMDMQSVLLKALATRMVVPLESAPLDKRYLKAKVGAVREHAHGLAAAMDAACVPIAKTVVRFSPTEPASRQFRSLQT